MTSTTRDIGQRLKTARLSCGLSRAALAVAAGLSVSCVQSVESGRKRPLPETAEALSTALGVDLAGIVNPEGDTYAEWAREYSRGQVTTTAMVYCDGCGWAWGTAPDVGGSDGYRTHKAAKDQATEVLHAAGYSAMGRGWDDA